MEKFIVSESVNGELKAPMVFETMTEAYNTFSAREYEYVREGYESDIHLDCMRTLTKGESKVSILLSWYK